MDSGSQLTHIFSSNLQRAFKTADTLRISKSQDRNGSSLQVMQISNLREQDFGFYEGKPFHARLRDSDKLKKETNRLQNSTDPIFQDVESKESMDKRTDEFVKEYLVPLIQARSINHKATVAVVAHGIILTHLWKSLLKLFAKNTVSLAPGLPVGLGRITPLEYLGGWSNTGYLEVDIRQDIPLQVGTDHQPHTAEYEDAQGSLLPPNLRMEIITINGTDHLKGLKRTRGVGSSQYDEGQKKIESFFKRSKFA